MNSTPSHNGSLLASAEDLVVAGVIDPTKVTRTALQNAASIASLMFDDGSNDSGDSEEEVV